MPRLVDGYGSLDYNLLKMKRKKNYLNLKKDLMRESRE